jgi:hypothetical protein
MRAGCKKEKSVVPPLLSSFPLHPTIGMPIAVRSRRGSSAETSVWHKCSRSISALLGRRSGCGSDGCRVASVNWHDMCLLG